MNELKIIMNSGPYNASQVFIVAVLNYVLNVGEEEGFHIKEGTILSNRMLPREKTRTHNFSTFILNGTEMYSAYLQDIKDKKKLKAFGQNVFNHVSNPPNTLNEAYSRGTSGRIPGEHYGNAGKIWSFYGIGYVSRILNELNKNRIFTPEEIEEITLNIVHAVDVSVVRGIDDTIRELVSGIEFEPPIRKHWIQEAIISNLKAYTGGDEGLTYEFKKSVKRAHMFLKEEIIRQVGVYLKKRREDRERAESPIKEPVEIVELVRADGAILTVPKSIVKQEILKDPVSFPFVISEQSGLNWNVHALAFRKFNAGWRGLRYEQLEEVSGVKGAVYCSKGGTSFIAKNNEGAREAVRKTLGL